jgi:hypothetical protein
MARENIISEYGFDPFAHHLQDIVVHLKNNTYYPPSSPVHLTVVE